MHLMHYHDHGSGFKAGYLPTRSWLLLSFNNIRCSSLHTAASNSTVNKHRFAGKSRVQIPAFRDSPLVCARADTPTCKSFYFVISRRGAKSPLPTLSMHGAAGSLRTDADHQETTSFEPKVWDKQPTDLSLVTSPFSRAVDGKKPSTSMCWDLSSASRQCRLRARVPSTSKLRAMDWC
jgi:hypothetical protein